MQRYHLLIAVHLSLVFVSAVRGQEKMVRELEALQVQFQTRVKTDAEEPFQKGLADLNGQYARALDLALEEAQKFGKLDEAVKIKTEQLRVTSGQPMPMADEGDLSDSLKRLRQTYRKSLSLLVNRRDTPIFVLQKAYAKQLNELIAALTKQGRLEDALAVRERLIALPPSGAVLTPPIAEQPQPLVPGNPPTPMKPFGPLPKDGFTNSLGMKFVAVPDTNVLMCIHETRRQDYSEFAAETPGADRSWRDVGYKGAPVSEGDDHPVVAVSWDDAQAFCEWLSNKEGRVYRLPTDREWSIAVGIAADEKIRKDTTPETLSGKIQNVFPWGTKWPPPDGAGNYADAFLKAKLPTQSAIPDYTDGHPTTAAVMSFKPNKLGIFDLGGNVSEWCEDWANEKMIYRVMRGASWSQFERAILFSSHRSYGAPDYRQMTETGFRCVIDTRSRAGASTIAPMPSPTTLPPAVPPKTPATAIKSDFTNSLGMKFVPVPGTKVLFCIHPTRVKDYAMYATETPDVNDRWKNNERDGVPISQGDEYPVVAVNWDDANAFCSWLSNKEGRTYRLPTDREWSFAVDIASNEMVRKDTTPESLHAKLRNVFAWGTKWPPPDGAGNYADTSFGKAFPTQRFIANYTDGFPTTSPVMSFKPNKYGLYDMGGNIRQWCEDKWNTTQPDRVLRGSNWQADDQGQTLSSHRDHPTPDQRTPERGFRVVVVSDR